MKKFLAWIGALLVYSLMLILATAALLQPQVVQEAPTPQLPPHQVASMKKDVIDPYISFTYQLNTFQQYWGELVSNLRSLKLNLENPQARYYFIGLIDGHTPYRYDSSAGIFFFVSEDLGLEHPYYPLLGNLSAVLRTELRAILDLAKADTFDQADLAARIDSLAHDVDLYVEIIK